MVRLLCKNVRKEKRMAVKGKQNGNIFFSENKVKDRVEQICHLTSEIVTKDLPL